MIIVSNIFPLTNLVAIYWIGERGNLTMEEVERIFIDITPLSLEEQEKYRGLDVAIVDGKIVAVGHTSVEAFKRAKALFPDRNPEDIIIRYISPVEDVLIL